MATVPNYYYNAPWMESIGRNLASALQPPDLDKLRAREQNEWQFQYAQNKASNEETDRQNNIRSKRAVGDMYELQRNPILGLDGKVDMAATEKRAFELADEAMTYGPKDVRAEVEDGLFNLSPNFARKRILQRQAEAFRSDQLTRSLAGAIDQIKTRGGIQQGLQDDAQDFELRKMREQFQLRGREWQQRAYLKAQAAGQEPITITPALADRMFQEILRFEKYTGNHLTDEERMGLFGESTELAQTSRNPITAVHERWNARFPYARFTDIPTQEVQEPGTFDNWLGNTDPYLKPVDNVPPVPTIDPSAFAGPTPEERRNFSDPVTQFNNPFLPPSEEQQMESASRAAAGAETNALPPAPSGNGAVRAPPAKLLKEGIETTFKGKGTWTLKNGVPTRVK